MQIGGTFGGITRPVTLIEMPATHILDLKWKWTNEWRDNNGQGMEWNGMENDRNGMNGMEWNGPKWNGLDQRMEWKKPQ